MDNTKSAEGVIEIATVRPVRWTCRAQYMEHAHAIIAAPDGSVLSVACLPAVMVEAPTEIESITMAVKGQRYEAKPAMFTDLPEAFSMRKLDDE